MKFIEFINIPRRQDTALPLILIALGCVSVISIWVSIYGIFLASMEFCSGTYLRPLAIALIGVASALAYLYLLKKTGQLRNSKRLLIIFVIGLLILLLPNLADGALALMGMSQNATDCHVQ